MYPPSAPPTAHNVITVDQANIVPDLEEIPLHKLHDNLAAIAQSDTNNTDYDTIAQSILIFVPILIYLQYHL